MRASDIPEGTIGKFEPVKTIYGRTELPGSGELPVLARAKSHTASGDIKLKNEMLNVLPNNNGTFLWQAKTLEV